MVLLCARCASLSLGCGNNLQTTIFAPCRCSLVGRHLFRIVVSSSECTISGHVRPIDLEADCLHAPSEGPSILHMFASDWHASPFRTFGKRFIWPIVRVVFLWLLPAHGSAIHLYPLRLRQLGSPSARVFARVFVCASDVALRRCAWPLVLHTCLAGSDGTVAVFAKGWGSSRT